MSPSTVALMPLVPFICDNGHATTPNFINFDSPQGSRISFEGGAVVGSGCEKCGAPIRKVIEGRLAVDRNDPTGFSLVNGPDRSRSALEQLRRELISLRETMKDSRVPDEVAYERLDRYATSVEQENIALAIEVRKLRSKPRRRIGRAITVLLLALDLYVRAHDLYGAAQHDISWILEKFSSGGTVSVEELRPTPEPTALPELAPRPAQATLATTLEEPLGATPAPSAIPPQTAE